MSTGLWQSMAMHYVYLLESSSEGNRRYVGYTNNLRQRIVDHNRARNSSTAKGGPWRLHSYVAFSIKLQALDFERYLKSGSGHAFAKRRLW